MAVYRFGMWLNFCALLVVFCVSQALSQSDDAHIIPRARINEIAAASGASIPGLTTRPLRVDVDLVLIPVTVTDSYNHPVLDLSTNDFLLYDGEKPQKVQYFSREDAPISIALVLDYSASMKNKIDYEKQAIAEFLNNANPADEYFAIGVSSKPLLVASAATSLETLQNEFATLQPHGGTALFDGIYLGLQQLRHARYKRKALLVISDGGDNDSRYTLKEIRSMVAESDVITYAIGLFDDVPLPLFKSFEERWGRKWLGTITDVSGGRTIAADSRQRIPEIAAIISRELRHQYVLGYKPENQLRDGKWRKVSVRTVSAEGRPWLHVYYKEGYFAPAQ